MNERKYRSLAKYAGMVADGLGVGHLHISLHPESPGEAKDGSAAAASWEGTYGRNQGVIRVNPAFDTYPPEEQRVVIVHELLHAHTEALREHVRTSLAPVLGQSVFDVFMAGFTQHDERFTDALATAIAPSFPLWEGK